MNPWDEPEIASIISILGGKVIDIKQINIVNVNSEVDYEEIQR